MEISEEQRKQLLSYMWGRPYGEVAQLIAMLASLAPKKNDRSITVLVRDLQQILGQFTDKFNKGMGKVEGKGNAIMYAKVYVDIGNNRLSEIQKIEAHENTLIGATEGVRVVLKLAPQNKSKLIL